MTIERTCDVCGREKIGRSYTHDRLKTHVGRLQTEVMVCLDGTWNYGDVCYECIVGHFNAAFGAGEHSVAQGSTNAG